jgi:hypothetical protein
MASGIDLGAYALTETAGQHSEIQILVNLADIVFQAQSSQRFSGVVHQLPITGTIAETFRTTAATPCQISSSRSRRW